MSSITTFYPTSEMISVRVSDSIDEEASGSSRSFEEIKKERLQEDYKEILRGYQEREEELHVIEKSVKANIARCDQRSLPKNHPEYTAFRAQMQYSEHKEFGLQLERNEANVRELHREIAFMQKLRPKMEELDKTMVAAAGLIDMHIIGVDFRPQIASIADCYYIKKWYIINGKRYIRSDKVYVLKPYPSSRDVEQFRANYNHVHIFDSLYNAKIDYLRGNNYDLEQIHKEDPIFVKKIEVELNIPQRNLENIQERFIGNYDTGIRGIHGTTVYNLCKEITIDGVAHDCYAAYHIRDGLNYTDEYRVARSGHKTVYSLVSAEKHFMSVHCNPESIKRMVRDDQCKINTLGELVYRQSCKFL